MHEISIPVDPALAGEVARDATSDLTLESFNGPFRDLSISPPERIQGLLEGFSPVSWEDRATFDHALQRFPQRTSEMSFVNVFAWASIQYPRWAEIDGHVIVSYDPGNTGASNKFLPPIGPDPIGVMERLHRDFGAVFTRVDMEYQGKIPVEVPTTETPGDHDYLYSPQQIRSLEGSASSELRRRVKKIEKLGDAISSAEISLETLDHARTVVDKWLSERIASTGDLGKRDDAQACLRILDKWSELPQLRGTVIYHRGEPVSLSIGEILSHPETPGGTFVIHFEKSMLTKELEGLPILSFQRLCAGLNDDCVINRMQSAGVEGLRKWKESWGPSGQRQKIAVGTAVYPIVTH